MKIKNNYLFPLCVCKIFSLAIRILLRARSLPLSIALFLSAPSFSLSPCSSLPTLHPPPSALPLFLSAPLLSLLQLVAMATEGLSSFRQQWSGARGCHHGTLSFSLSPHPLSLFIQLTGHPSLHPVTHPDLSFVLVSLFSFYQHH